MNQILVSGANGQVGYELVKLGPRYDFEILGCDRSNFDITSTESIFSALENNKPDLIINAAAYTNVDKAEMNSEAAYLSNQHGVFNLANACVKLNIPLFHISTDYVFDGTKDNPYIETDPVSPISVYGKSKLAGESAIRKILKKHLILRTSWVFSERGNNFLKTILNLADKKKEIQVVQDQFGGPTSASSIANILLRLSKMASNKSFTWGTYHFCQSPYVSWYDFAKYILANAHEIGLLDNNLEILPILSKNYPYVAQRPRNSTLSNIKLFEDFGIETQSWKNDVKEIIRVLKGV